MRNRRWLALTLLPVLLLAGDYFYWRLAVSQLRDSFETWAIRTKGSGWDVRHGTVTAGGWPDAATLRVQNLTVAASGLTGAGGALIGDFPVRGLVWGSDVLLLSSSLTRPDALEVTPVGLHALRLDRGPPIPITVDHLFIRLHLSLNAFPRAVDIEALTLTASIAGLGLVSVGHLEAHADLKPNSGKNQPIMAFAASAESVLLPDGMRFGLGPEISDVAVEGTLNGPWPTGGRDLTTRATAWRDEGGSLDLRRLAIGWGKARLDASATLALDEDLQPMGVGTGKIVGFAAALDALSANAVLTRSAAKAAKAVLSLLANTPTDDQPEEVEVPLTLQFRTLSLRQVPLVRFPVLDWPQH